MGDNKLTASNALATNSYSKISEIILGDEVLDYKTIRELALSGTNEKQNIYGYKDKENIINAGGGDDYIEGYNKNDTLNGEGGNDTIRGYSGNDILNGGKGNDTYIFGKDWGVDTISNYDSYKITDNSSDTIHFKDGIKASDLKFSSNSRYDLIITQGENKITANYALDKDERYNINKIVFDDNSELSFNEIKLLAAPKDEIA